MVLTHRAFYSAPVFVHLSFAGNPIFNHVLIKVHVLRVVKLDLEKNYHVLLTLINSPDL